MIPEEAMRAAQMAAMGRYLNKATVELILEAAIPHLEKDAYARGWGAGFRHTRAAVEHHCESWQLLMKADGGEYCGACGKTQP